MKDFAALKNRITAAVSVAGKDHPYGVLNQELRALAAEMGVLTTSRKAQVKFEINGHKAALSFSGQGTTSQFMLQTDQVSQTPFALCDASEFARLIAATHVPELCELLLQADATATESVAHAIRTVRAVREALILSPPKPTAAPKEFVVEEAAQELTAQYVHNLRVRYEGLLDIVRIENERLHQEIRNADQRLAGADQDAIEADRAYTNLFDLCESVFCGSQGDPSNVNLDALNKLMDVVRKRAHEKEDPR